MNNFKIISDTSCDLTNDIIEKYDIGLVPFKITFDGVNYLKEGVDITIEEFYDKISVKGVFPKTSLPSIQDYADKFKPYLEEGQDILCICLTSEFSGSYGSAVNAAEMLLEEYPDRNIKIMDSRAVTFLQGLLVMDIGEYRSQGKNIDEVYNLVESYKNENLIYLTLDTLEYLEKGGRIGKASAFAGGILNIKPIIKFKDGGITPHSKVRGRKKALNEVVELSAEFLKGKENEYRVKVLHNRCENDAKEIESYVKAKGIIPLMGIGHIGVTITAHGGLGMTGIVMLKNKP
ncbi:MAG: DegV family protein [Defluviitaleaceae bacterium]|nr:DegV family protein [Defluviitaleaceae bacterium]